MHRARTLLAILVTLLAPACVSTDHVDLEEFLVDQALVMTTDDPPPEASPLAVVAVHQSGFYLLGLIPFAPVRLEDCVAEIAERALELGADGVANLVVEYTPPSAMKFVAFPIPDWGAEASIRGMTYRMPTNPAYPPQPH